MLRVAAPLIVPLPLAVIENNVGSFAGSVTFVTMMWPVTTAVALYVATSALQPPVPPPAVLFA